MLVKEAILILQKYNPDAVLYACSNADGFDQTNRFEVKELQEAVLEHSGAHRETIVILTYDVT